MFIIKPYIFNEYPDVITGVSTLVGLERKIPYCFNLSLKVGDNPDTVFKNREAFFKYTGFDQENVVLQDQIHSDIITVAERGGNCGESDALITNKKDLLLVLTVADCTPILLYDKKNNVIAAVHSGWRGAQSGILNKTLSRLSELFHSDGNDIVAYLGPSISQVNYEVGNDVAEFFDNKYILKIRGKSYLDVAAVNYDELIDFNVKEYNIQKSLLCTYQMHELFHSYRRDGSNSGRSFAVIGMKS